MGGTLFHLTPYAVSALAGLKERLPRMGEYVAWARSLAAELSALGLTVKPEPPHTNTFLVFADGTREEVMERKVAFMERERIEPCGGWYPAQVPGMVMTEVAAHDAALEHDPKQVATWIAEIVQG
jgi:threonine aldolase